MEIADVAAEVGASAKALDQKDEEDKDTAEVAAEVAESSKVVSEEQPVAPAPPAVQTVSPDTSGPPFSLMSKSRSPSLPSLPPHHPFHPSPRLRPPSPPSQPPHRRHQRKSPCRNRPLAQQHHPWVLAPPLPPLVLRAPIPRLVQSRPPAVQSPAPRPLPHPTPQNLLQQAHFQPGLKLPLLLHLRLPLASRLRPSEVLHPSLPSPERAPLPARAHRDQVLAPTRHKRLRHSLVYRQRMS